MDLYQLPSLAEDYAPYRELKEQLAAKGRIVQLEGVSVAAKGFFLTQLLRDLDRPLLIVTYNVEQAERMVDDFTAFGVPEESIAYLVSTAETLLFTEGAPDYALIGKRLNALARIHEGKAKVIIGAAGAFLQRMAPIESVVSRVVTAKSGETLEVEDLQRRLAALGYERVESVELPGHWTRRGGIIDVFPTDGAQPVRFDFFGDEIESLRTFDPETQRSTGNLESIRILAAREMPLDETVVDSAIERIKAELPGRIQAVRKENLEERGEEHAARLEERVEGDIVNLSNRAYFDQAEVYLPYLYPENRCALDFAPADAVLILDEPSQMAARWEQTETEMTEIAATRAARGEWLQASLPTYCEFETLAGFAKDKNRSVALFSLLARSLSWLKIDREIPANVIAMDAFTGRMPGFFEALDSWLGNRFRCVIVSRQARRLRELLAEQQIPAAPNTRLRPHPSAPSPDGRGGEKPFDGGVYVFDGLLPGGFKLPDAGLMVLTDTDIFGLPVQQKARRSYFKEGMRIASYLELREGDYVVHIQHGIGLYRGISKLAGNDGAERDYLLLEYAGGDKVYVPTDQVDRVQRYIGSGGELPEVHRLHSGEWQRATSKAKKQVKEMAAGLIKLYAARQAAHRPPCPPDTPWQEEMEHSFPYEETPGQMTAIHEVKDDLEDERPMDRLICGDVGYGKTEVAIRAAFKMVNSGRQVAVLCPTTILAEQHLGTFRQRLAAYPVKIEMLSRFVGTADTQRVLKGLTDGTVDIVIGTHKLLGKNVLFHNLGLLVIDEEQRFGVAHKEKIKQLKKSVDVMTLTATPIPRTLHMALSGIRDLSLINDPPEGRLPIKTYVREYDDELVREVILRELDRGGQIYYVSNRIEGLAHIAYHVERLVPQARIGVGHGQMSADELEDVMMKFYGREYDILVCTTIIESGLDVPNVNTIVVENADKLGLAQLYQLRGRVGRSDKQSYAYLLYRKNKQLSENAEQRLSALKDFSDLGSGYKVALRDLEIRGAGNLLGAEQSGTVADVGFDLYTQLLSQAINELKGEPAEEEFNLPSVNLPLDAHIPERYIPSEAERILIYKKLTAVRTKGDVDDLQAELEDRYGDPTRAVWNLLALLRLRLRCKEVGIGSINTERQRVVLRFSGTHLPPETTTKLARSYLQYEFYTERVVLPLADTPVKTLNAVENIIEVLAKALPDKSREARVGVSTGMAPPVRRHLRRSMSGGYR
jgi:transcription-repair coupling factor (superfamily II helicase)